MIGDLPSGWTADPVGRAEFLQKPEDALRAGVLEVVDDDHRP
jgi:hypothetical protein